MLPRYTPRHVGAMVVSILLLLVLCPFTISASALVASGDPIDFVSVNDFGDTAVGFVMNAEAFGMNLSFSINNNLRNGVRGRPLRLVVRDNGDNSSLTYSLLAEALAFSPNATAVVGIINDESIRESIRFVGDRPSGSEMMLVNPFSGAKEFYRYSKLFATFSVSGDAEIYSFVRYLAQQHQTTRVALVTEVNDVDSLSIAVNVQRLLTEVGATLTYHYALDYMVDPNNYNLTAMQELFATKPHAVIVLSALFPNTAATLLALMVTLPTAQIVFTISLLTLANEAFKMLPSLSVIGERAILSNFGPLYTDTSSLLAARFRTELAANSNSVINIANIDSNPPLGTFVYFGWVVGEMLATVTSSLVTVDAPTFQKTLFSDRIFSIEEVIVGPFSGECVGTRRLFCKCNNGARSISLVRYTPQLTLVPVTNFEFVIPLTTCTAENLTLDSSLVAATITPASNDAASRATTDYLTGRNASANSGDIAIDGVLVQQTYTGNSVAALQYLNTEKLLTAFAGSILNTPIGDATGIGAVIDPMEVRPRLYGGFRRDVVYVSPTYEQELHALASLAVERGKAIGVLSALEDDGSLVGATLTRSMNTLGREGGGHRSSTTIAEGLGSTGDGGVTVLHGIATTSDIAAIATHLEQKSNALVAIPMAHLLVWYRELVATVTDEGQRSRIVFATSLPNWAGPVSGETTGPALQTYFNRVPATNRTPGSLRGYMTHQLLTYVTSRVPTVKSPAEFLRMLYGASVIVMDTGLVAGPYFDGACGSASGSCEMNIGARVIRVRSLAASMTSTDGTASGQDASSITLDSGRIAYKGLPTADNTVRNIIIIVAVVGGVLVLGGALAVVLVLCCTGRSNRTAPKDEKEPFTIAFTDIQSSTNLWAEAPEAMAYALSHHHTLLRKLCGKHRGYEVKTIGDAFMVAFKDASDAVDFSYNLQFDFFSDDTWSPALDHAYLEMDQSIIQDMSVEEKASFSIALSPEDYSKVWNGLRVRIGIHTGFGEIKKDPVSHGYDYYGTVVNTAARTEAIAHGGQVIMTEATLAASHISQARVVPMGLVMLRGVPDPVEMYQLTTVLNRVFPPLKVGRMISKIAGDDNEKSGNLLVSTFSQSTNGLFPKAGPKDNIQGQVMAVLKTFLSVQPPGPRGKFLMDTCRRWQLEVPTSDDDRTAFVTSPDALDKLSAKIAPIMARRKEFGFVGRGGKCGTDEASQCSTRTTGEAAFTALSSDVYHGLDPAVEASGDIGIVQMKPIISNEVSPFRQNNDRAVANPFSPVTPSPSHHYPVKSESENEKPSAVINTSKIHRFIPIGQGVSGNSMYDVQEALPQSVVNLPFTPATTPVEEYERV